MGTGTIVLLVFVLIIGAGVAGLSATKRRAEKTHQAFMAEKIKPLNLKGLGIKLETKLITYRDLGKVKRLKPERMYSESTLIRQFCYPETCCMADQTLGHYTDRLYDRNPIKFSSCLRKYQISGIQNLAAWFQTAHEEKIIGLLEELLLEDTAADPDGKPAPTQKTAWTGFQITYAGLPHSLWMVLFAKHPLSNTVVYTGFEAPNVIQ